MDTTAAMVFASSTTRMRQAWLKSMGTQARLTTRASTLTQVASAASNPAQPSSPQRHHPATHSCRCALKPVHHADSVGPGIYGGKVKRDDQGNVIIGKQFQNHNPTPGPVYAGGGYTAMSKALSQVSTCVRVQGRAMRGGIPFKSGARDARRYSL